MSEGNPKRTLKLATWLVAAPYAVSYFLETVRPPAGLRGYHAFWFSLVSFPAIFTSEVTTDHMVLPAGLAWIANLLVVGLLVSNFFSAPPKWLRRVLAVLAVMSPPLAWWILVYMASEMRVGYYLWAGCITLFSVLAFFVIRRGPEAAPVQSGDGQSRD